jgi:hypothetical protein
MGPIKRLLLSAAFLLFVTLAVFAQSRKEGQSGELRGSVADAAENAPIRYAVVLVRGGSGKKNVNAKVDERGRFGIVLAPGLYDVFVTADGFAPSCRKIEVSAGRIATFEARLKADTEHLEHSSH